MTRRFLPGLIFATCASLHLAACARVPRTRPLPTTPIATGPETSQAARKAFEGSWTLVSLEVAAQDGRPTSVEATGVFISDAFGNVRIEYRVSEAGLNALAALGIDSPNPVISTSGRVAIDTQGRRITYIPPDAATRTFDPGLAALRTNPFALERPRYYVLGEDGILTLRTRHDDGRDAAVSRWKKGL